MDEEAKVKPRFPSLSLFPVFRPFSSPSSTYQNTCTEGYDNADVTNSIENGLLPKVFQKYMGNKN